MAYIRQHQLPNLKNYRYNGVDHSLISYYILKPFYTNFVLKCFPLNMAPNLITLTGFGFIVINFLTLLWYNPTLDKDCPSWVYASWSVGLFLYQTFDAIDGAQARRTRQSGPLGELFDHSVDAVNTSLGVLIFAASLNLGMGWMTVFALFLATSAFYVQTWEEYHTKTLTLAIVSGPVEGVLMLVFIYALTALKGGASIWQQPIFHETSSQNNLHIPRLLRDLSLSDLYSIQGGLCLVCNTFQSSLNVLKAYSNKPSQAFLGLIPHIVTWSLIPIYLHFNQEVLYNNLVPFILFVGLINAYSVGKMITAHIVQLDFPYFNILVLPLAYGVFDSVGPLFQEKLGIGWPSVLGTDDHQVAYCFCMLGCAIGVYGSFVVDIIITICDYLDIWCLTIKNPHNENEDSKTVKKTA